MEESTPQNTEQEPAEASSVDSHGNSNNGGFTPMSTDELKKQDRNRRTEKLIGSIGDSIMALTNLFFTTKGAPSFLGGTDEKGEKRDSFLSTAIMERHSKEDELYAKRYAQWDKEQERLRKQTERALQARKKEEEANRRVMLRENFGILERNWADEDYINQMFGCIIDVNKDPKLRRILDSFQFSYEPIWEWNDTGWSYTVGHDKKIDNFKGKAGTYLKRDLIEALFGDDGWTTPENRDYLIQLMTEFDNNWIRIK